MKPGIHWEREKAVKMAKNPTGFVYWKGSQKSWLDESSYKTQERPIEGKYPNFLKRQAVMLSNNLNTCCQSSSLSAIYRRPKEQSTDFTEERLLKEYIDVYGKR